ncbi:MAG TPA: hypothetical protein VJ672_03915 [Gemmatimonadaceae bacterium]|nr:hypothetical protein [Gemmatimonadaceae bacterium]
MITAIVQQVRRALPLVITWIVFAMLLTLIASTYVGHAASPYDMCTRADGRPIACALLRASGP